MAKKSLALRIRRLRINLHLGLILVLSLAAWPAVAQDGGRDRDRAAADHAFAEGMRLWKEGSETSKLRAIEKYRESVALWRALGDRSSEVAAIKHVGGAYYALGKYSDALENLEQALRMARGLGDRRNE